MDNSGWGDARFAGPQATGLRSTPIRSISHSTTSPALRNSGGVRAKPTPLGVLQGQACFRKSYKNNRDRAGSITDFRKTKAPSEGEAFG